MNVMVKKEWIEKGYVDEPVDEALDLKAEIKKLCKEKDAIILAQCSTASTNSSAARRKSRRRSLTTRFPVWRSAAARRLTRLPSSTAKHRI